MGNDKLTDPVPADEELSVALGVTPSDPDEEVEDTTAADLAAQGTPIDDESEDEEEVSDDEEADEEDEDEEEPT